MAWKPSTELLGYASWVAYGTFAPPAPWPSFLSYTHSELPGYASWVPYGTFAPPRPGRVFILYPSVKPG